MREKNCNITPFVQSSPRLNNQTPRSNRTKILQRSRTTARETDVQLDSHQRRVQGYRKHYRFCGDRIDHDVPSYDRSHIETEDKRRKDDRARIGGSGGKCRMGSPLDSGREDGIESTRLEGWRRRVGEHQDEEVLEWERRVRTSHQEGECVGRYP